MMLIITLGLDGGGFQWPTFHWGLYIVSISILLLSTECCRVFYIATLAPSTSSIPEISSAPDTSLSTDSGNPITIFTPEITALLTPGASSSTYQGTPGTSLTTPYGTVTVATA